MSISLTLFSFTLILFDNLAYTKYILLQRSSDEEYIEHHKSTLTVVYYFRVKNYARCFSNGAPIHIDQGPSDFTNVEKRSIQKKGITFF